MFFFFQSTTRLAPGCWFESFSSRQSLRLYVLLVCRVSCRLLCSPSNQLSHSKSQPILSSRQSRSICRLFFSLFFSCVKNHSPDPCCFELLFRRNHKIKKYFYSLCERFNNHARHRTIHQVLLHFFCSVLCFQHRKATNHLLMQYVDRWEASA